MWGPHCKGAICGIFFIRKYVSITLRSWNAAIASLDPHVDHSNCSGDRDVTRDITGRPPSVSGGRCQMTAKKTWHMTQLTFSSNFYWKICFKFCILEQIIATVLFICISSINNKRSLLRFQSTTALTNRGWSACGDMWSHTFTVFRNARTRFNLSDRKKCFIKHRIWHVLTQMLI